KTNAVWKRNLAVSYEKVGDVKAAQGKLPEALDAYQESLATAERLVESDSRFQWNFAVSYEKVGNVLEAQGKLAEALDVYQQEMAIAKRLADQDKTNADWQRNLALSYKKVGDVNAARGKLPEALDVYQQAIAHFTKALQLDPNQYDSYLGGAHAKQIIADFQGALKDYLRYVDLAPQDQRAKDHAQLFIWLLRAREGRIFEANLELSAYLERRPDASTGDWIAKIGNFLLDKIGETDFFAAAGSSDRETDRGQHCEASYYAGMKRLLGGDKTTAAEYLRKCLATQETNFDEYIFAHAEIQRIGPTM